LWWWVRQPMFRRDVDAVLRAAGGDHDNG
jgi:hypothetical protein